MRDLAPLFKALADETRLQMLALLLRHGELCVCDLEHALDITQSKSSRHLKTLRQAGLVDARRQAVWIHYRAADAPDADQRVALCAAGALFAGERGLALDARLAAWRHRKRERPTACGAPTAPVQLATKGRPR